jgi:hypothetical protein
VGGDLGRGARVEARGVGDVQLWEGMTYTSVMDVAVNGAMQKDKRTQNRFTAFE